ncbi:MAG: polyribonucleotide nucleotidyltransferase [Chloroflexi bacterium]|nr:MAG: polyribonucleotide nucleotidyltransferase [Chloroflexota bacterium]
MVDIFSREIGGKTLTIELGRYAEESNGAVVVRCGDTIVLTTANSAKAREGIDFFPLTVDYEERLYAAGKIPGSFFRREGRPTEDAILADRLTDRSLRPLFPKDYRNEVQVITTVLSVDHENPPEILSIIGASAALTVSDIPFEGPIGACRVGYVDGELIINPTYQQTSEGHLELVVSSTKDAVVMVESGANEIKEELLLEAIELGRSVNAELVSLQEEIAHKLGKANADYVSVPQPSHELISEMESKFKGRLSDFLDKGGAKGERSAVIDGLKQEAKDLFTEEHGAGLVAEAFGKLLKKIMRDNILNNGRRPDGRSPEEIRPISVEVGVLPRTHGTGMFKRGQTQVLSIATLGSLTMKQNLDTLSPNDTKRYMHHYNFPPSSVGEVRRMGGAGRREIGHGALAERALVPLMPDEDEFPYTIRIVSEVMSSNGSTSMASVCGSTLALMDAGVPIKKPVAGIAMGLIVAEEGGRYSVLTDIQGVEDFQGDMDFKVAGTDEGVTALQMDVKVKGISFDVMKEALEQARKGRLFILDKMLEVMPQPRGELSSYAPRMQKMSIPVDKIGAVIGPGGRTIRAIIQETKATIDIENDGTVTIGSTNEESAKAAIDAVNGLTRDPEVGEIYTGKVTRVMDFGAFVEIMPGKEGLVHISQLSDHHVEKVEDEVSVGDEITVMLAEVDRMGRINLSRRAVYAEEGTGDGDRQSNDDRPNRGGNDGGGDRRGGYPSRSDDRQGGRGSGGPGRGPQRH